jgi:hypothetical protein
LFIALGVAHLLVTIATRFPGRRGASSSDTSGNTEETVR